MDDLKTTVEQYRQQEAALQRASAKYEHTRQKIEDFLYDWMNDTMEELTDELPFLKVTEHSEAGKRVYEEVLTEDGIELQGHYNTLEVPLNRYLEQRDVGQIAEGILAVESGMEPLEVERHTY